MYPNKTSCLSMYNFLKINLIRLIFKILVSNIKSSQSVVDYDKLKQLQEFSNDPDDREETHYMFMKQYLSVLKPQPKRAWTSR